MDTTATLTAQNSAQTPEMSQPLAFGGWLIFVGIGIWVGPFRLLASLWGLYQPLFSDGNFEDILHAASAGFITLIFAEMLLNMLIFAGSIYLIYLYMRKSALLPKWYLLVAATAATFLSLDALATSLMFPDLEVMTKDMIQSFGTSAVALLIWTPYLHFSQRAKQTFIR